MSYWTSKSFRLSASSSSSSSPSTSSSWARILQLELLHGIALLNMSSLLYGFLLDILGQDTQQELRFPAFLQWKCEVFWANATTFRRGLEEVLARRINEEDEKSVVYPKKEYAGPRMFTYDLQIFAREMGLGVRKFTWLKGIRVIGLEMAISPIIITVCSKHCSEYIDVGNLIIETDVLVVAIM
eukprot:Gb_00009 [translate_table: standard]